MSYSGQSKKIIILFVAANPIAVPRLMLDEEIREIEHKILAAEHRNLVEIKSAWAARPDDLLQAFNKYRPNIVHFSAHGSPSGQIILTNNSGQAKPVSVQALQALFTIVKDDIRAVILNACYSKIQAQAITNVIDCAIGMSDSIDDTAAIAFSASFYRAIAFGRSVQEAFEQGKVAIQLEGLPRHDIPTLLVRSGVDASQICILASAKDTDGVKRVQITLLNGDYDLAYRDIGSILRSYADELSDSDMAKLKYLEALVHLEGKRPYVQSPSVMQSCERLLKTAIQFHQTYTYVAILAALKYDFARAGLRKHEVEADGLASDMQWLQPNDEDRENIRIFALAQPSLYHDYRSFFRI